MSVERLGLIVVGMLVLLVLVLVVSAAMACGWPCHYVANDLKWDRVPWLLIGPLWPFVQIPLLPYRPHRRPVGANLAASRLCFCVWRTLLGAKRLSPL